MTFTEKDAAHTGHPHMLPLYITNYIEDFEVHKVLIDKGAGLNLFPLRTAETCG